MSDDPSPSAPGRSRGSLRDIMRTSTLDGVFATGYANLTTGTLLTTFLLLLGASDFLVGLVAAFPLLAGLMQPFGAEIIRRTGGRRKPILITAALIDDLLWLVSLAAVVYLDAPGALGVVVVVLVVQYAFGAFVTVSWTSWISDLIPPSLRGRYFGRRNFICHGFGALTAAIAGLVLRAAGPHVHVFVGLIGIGVIFRLISISFLRRQPEPSPARSPRLPMLEQMATPLRSPDFRRFLTYAMAWGFGVQLAAPFFTVYMVNEANVGFDTVMVFSAMGTVSNLIGQRVWGPLCDRYGDHQVMRVAGFSIALQPVWWLFTSTEGPGFYLMAILSMTGGFAWGGHLMATGNLMMRLAPETGKTTYFAVQAALGGLFGAAGPFVGGLLATLFSGSVSVIPGLLVGLKNLFLISGIVRLFAWALLQRVPEPVSRPPLRAVYVLRDTARTFNPAQGFSPLLNLFTFSGVRTNLQKRRRAASIKRRARSRQR